MASLVPQVGDLVAGRYRVKAIADEGPGYLTLDAFDREVEIDVALLWFRPGLFPDPRARQGFLGDAVRARGLAHPHIRRIYDAHIEGESVFVAAQVGTGGPVARRIEAGRPSDELEIIRYASAIGQGLEVGHRVGTVHGYLVPTDIVDVASQIKVSAVGLYGSASPDVARDLFWTRRKYVAPEVLHGELPTPASDVFSLAVILTELATGISSVDIGDSAEELASQHIRLADIFARASRSDPADRTQTIAALLSEVRRTLVDDRVPTSERKAVKPPPNLANLAAHYDNHPTQVDHKRADSEGVTITKARPSAPEIDPSPVSLIDASGDPLGALGDPMGEPTVSDTDLTKKYTPVEPGELDDDDDLEPELIVVDTPPPERLGGTVEIDIDEVPVTIQGVAPASRSGSSMPLADPEPGRRDSTEPPPGLAGRGSQPPARPDDNDARPRFVSHKPSEPETPRTPVVPVLERPDGQPKVRPISSIRPPASVPPKSLGNYAPPRGSAPPGPRKPGKSGKSGLLAFLWSFAAILAVVLGGLIAVVVVRSSSRASAPVPDAAPPIDAAIVIIDAPPPRPCPETMALVRDGDLLFCIDLHEAPGEGKLPAIELGRPDAEARCNSRGARLCKNAEWQLACKSADGGSFPYGDRYEKDRCNLRSRELAKAGSFAECKSGVGAFDMSGNVAEWSAEGFVQGGSFRDRSRGRCSRRYRGSRQKEGYPDVGYRCCAEPNPEALAPADAGR